VRSSGPVTDNPNGQGAIRANISQQNLKLILVPIPPPPEQGAIATALKDIDALLEGLESLIAKKRTLKEAALQQLFTGQTRLPGFTGQWRQRAQSIERNEERKYNHERGH